MYDIETRFYYLQSRYYDPELGRFINADSYASTGQGILGNNMFAYCQNSPVNYSDSSGTIAAKSFSDNPMLGTDMLRGCAGGLGLILLGALIRSNNKKKPVNLPSSKKLSIDTEHIASGHMPDGSRNPKGNKDVFYGLSLQQVVNAVYEAYKNSTKLKTQGNSIKLLGYSESYNLWIEMWVDIFEFVIKTAYPKR